ncbi:MAG: histidine kinase [Ferruginibacter sp.]
MKRKLSAYGWCQVGGWGAYVLLATISYLPLPGFSVWNTLFPMILAGIMGMGITHLMRLLIIKSVLIQLNMARKIISLIVVTVAFSLVFASLSIWIFGVLSLGQELIYLYTHEYKINGLLVLMYSDTFFLGIWNLIYFSYHYVRKSQLQQIERIRLESELKIQQLENEKAHIEYQRNLSNYDLMALRSQMNPHFIFNCLNSIKLYTTQNDTEAATQYLTKFSKLIRLVMENSNKGKVLLSTELDMLRLYIDMEAMRFKEKLHYTITIEKDVEANYIELPPLLIQPYVENAIWHGLMPKEAGGKITIDIAMNNKKSLLIIGITDNGIGRTKSATLKENKSAQHESYGMKITSNRIALINHVYKTGADVQVDDLLDDNAKPSGTNVIIKIPV